MGKTRFAAIASAAAFSVVMSNAAFAVSSEGECINKAGTVMDLQSVKHCLVPVIPEEFQGEEYAAEILGVKECTGALRKTSIGDFCLIALEAKPAPVAAPAVVAETSSDQINGVIGEVSDAAAKVEEAADAVVEADEPKKKKSWWQ